MLQFCCGDGETAITGYLMSVVIVDRYVVMVPEEVRLGGATDLNWQANRLTLNNMLRLRGTSIWWVLRPLKDINERSMLIQTSTTIIIYLLLASGPCLTYCTVAKDL